MRIQFQATVEDFVDAHERAIARSRLVRSWHREGSAVTALAHGLLTSILVFIFTYVMWPLVPALIWSIGSGLIIAALAGNHHRHRVRQRVYSYYREMFGERQSLPCEVELGEAGLLARQLGTQILFEWPNVEEMRETEDAVEFYTYDGGGLLVKKKYFSSVDEIQQFMDVARQHLTLSRTSSNWLHAN
jgi:hypothetical protein